MQQPLCTLGSPIPAMVHTGLAHTSPQPGLCRHSSVSYYLQLRVHSHTWPQALSGPFCSTGTTPYDHGRSLFHLMLPHGHSLAWFRAKTALSLSVPWSQSAPSASVSGAEPALCHFYPMGTACSLMAENHLPRHCYATSMSWAQPAPSHSRPSSPRAQLCPAAVLSQGHRLPSAASPYHGHNLPHGHSLWHAPTAEAQHPLWGQLGHAWC